MNIIYVVVGALLTAPILMPASLANGHSDALDDLTAARMLDETHLRTAVTPPPATGSETEPNDSAATATAVTIGNVISGTLNPSDTDVDYFSFTASAGDIVVLEAFASRSTSNIVPRLELLATDGSTVLVNKTQNTFECCDAIMGLELTAAGTYYLRVTDQYPPSTPNDYVIAFSAGGKLSGTLTDPFDKAAYSSVIAFNTTGTPSSAYGEVQWISPDYVYELYVPSGTHRVTTLSGFRRWHNDKPTFGEADDISVNPNAKLTVDLLVDDGLSVRPFFSEINATTGGSVELDLEVKNSSVESRVIGGRVYAMIPGEAGIDPELGSFYAPDIFPIYEQDGIVVEGRSQVTLPDFFVYNFTGGEPEGRYKVCTEVVFQDGRRQNSPSNPVSCTTFFFRP